RVLPIGCPRFRLRATNSEEYVPYMRSNPSTHEDGSVLRSRQVVLAAAAAGAASLLIGSTLAVLTLRPAVVDSDGDGVPDSVEAATQRTVVAATAGHTFTIVSRLA